MSNNEHNPRTPRQMPAELRLGAARRQTGLSLRWAILATVIVMGLWVATNAYGLPLPR